MKYWLSVIAYTAFIFLAVYAAAAFVTAAPNPFQWSAADRFTYLALCAVIWISFFPALWR